MEAGHKRLGGPPQIKEADHKRLGGILQDYGKGS